MQRLRRDVGVVNTRDALKPKVSHHWTASLGRRPMSSVVRGRYINLPRVALVDGSPLQLVFPLALLNPEPHIPAAAAAAVAAAGCCRGRWKASYLLDRQADLLTPMVHAADVRGASRRGPQDPQQRRGNGRQQPCGRCWCGAASPPPLPPVPHPQPLRLPLGTTAVLITLAALIPLRLHRSQAKQDSAQLVPTACSDPSGLSILGSSSSPGSSSSSSIQ